MSALQKPTFVLVHGAWHNASCWNGVANELKAAGYESVAPELNCCNWDDPPTSHLQDVAIVRAAIEKLVSQGREVVMVMHSYGGIAGGGAIEGLEKKAGAPGGVIAAVFVAAFLTPRGSSLLDMFDEPAPYIVPNDRNPNFIDIVDPHATFYNDVTQDQSAPWTSTMRPQAIACFASKVTSVGWDYVPCTYISCRQDNGVYPWLQDRMVSAARDQAKYTWRTVTLESSHSAWLSQTSVVTQVALEAAKESPLIDQ